MNCVRSLHRFTSNPLVVKLKNFTWPFSEDQTQQILTALLRHLQRLQAAMNVETFKGMRELRKVWLNALSKKKKALINEDQTRGLRRS